MLQEDIMPIVKETISVSIKRNTHRGFIGWSGCDSICMDMQDCQEMCRRLLEAGRCMEALEASAYILVSGVKLASHADSSSGLLTEVVLSTMELTEACTKEIAGQEKKMRDKALAMLIKEVRKKVFDGWTEWRYGLLKCGICLCDGKSAEKLENALDILLEGIEEDCFPEYKRKEDWLVRYYLHRHLLGKEAVRTELYDHIGIKEFCIIAIRDAMESGDFDEAERLCLDKAEAEERRYYRKNDPEDWNNLLFQVYERAGDTEKQMMQAKKLLLFGNEKFWEVLKQIHEANGTWKSVYQGLLEELKDSRQGICYRTILIDENEKERLMEDVEGNPYDLFYYGGLLAEEYPERIYVLCDTVIRQQCAEAKDRREYRKVAKQIAQLIKWGGEDTAQKLIGELMQAYPRRLALADELKKLEKA